MSKNSRKKEKWAFFADSLPPTVLHLFPCTFVKLEIKDIGTGKTVYIANIVENAHQVLIPNCVSSFDCMSSFETNDRKLFTENGTWRLSNAQSWCVANPLKMSNVQRLDT